MMYKLFDMVSRKYRCWSLLGLKGSNTIYFQDFYQRLTPLKSVNIIGFLGAGKDPWKKLHILKCH